MAMKVILTTNTQKGIFVDDEDFERLSQYKWYENGRSIKRTKTGMIKTRNVPIANQVLQIFDVLIDHKDRNMFNNQKENLRICSPEQNSANRCKPKGAFTSRYKGVDWRCDRNKWRVKVGKLYVGLFDNEEDAARAYDIKALEVYGEFACLNFPKA